MILNPYAFATGGATDPYFASVVSLLHFNGADGSTTFTDQTGKVWTPSGGVAIDTDQSKFGGASGLFTNGKITTPSTADFAFGTGDFTVEVWARPSSGGGDQAVIDFNSVAPGFAIYAYFAAGGGFGAGLINRDTSAWIKGATGTVVANVQQHIAVSRESGTVRVFVGGTQTAAGTYTANLVAVPCTIGQNYIGTQPYNGHLDDLRVTKGVARYTANFTPPTAAFPNS